jgi:hypothetical protein
LLIQFLVIIGILFGGLMAAQKMGVYGAQGAIGMVKKVGESAGKWPAKRAQMLTAGLTGKMGRGMGKAGEWMKQKRGLKTIGRLTGQIARGPKAFEEQERAAFAEAEKKRKDWTTDNLKSDYRAANPRDKAAIAKILAERGELTPDEKFNFTDDDIEKAFALTKKYGQEGSLVKSRPDLAHLVKKADEDEESAIKNAVSKLKAKDIDKFQLEAIGKLGKEPKGNQKIVHNAFLEEFKKPGGKLGKSILVKAADENPALYTKLMKDIIEPNIKEMKGEIKEYYKATTGKAVTEEGKIIASASEADFKKAKEENYQGK